MSDKAEALRLADALENLEATGWGGDCFALTEHSEQQAQLAAAELRRLHAEIAENESVINVWRGRTQRAEAERDALKGTIRQQDAEREFFSSKCDALRAALIVAEEASARCKAVNDTTSECWRAECDALRAELDRLTTLRPAMEWHDDEALWWGRDGNTWLCDPLFIPSTHWTPLPKVKEAK